MGHCHPKVVDAINSHSNTDFYYEEVVNLAEKLCEITPRRFQKRVYLGNSGTEAVEAAVKLSKWHTRKHRFVSFIGGFHGRTLGLLAFTASKLIQKRYFFPLLPGVTHVPYPNCYHCLFKLSYPGCDYWCVDFIDEFVSKNTCPLRRSPASFLNPSKGRADT